ncbi:MAG: formylglycine-generating enzyme family protein [Motiliproteus sp.]
MGLNDMNKLTKFSVMATLLAATFPSQAANQWQDEHSAITFNRIESGCFEMGVDQTNPIIKGKKPVPPRPDERPQHRVCLDQYWLGQYEVTNAQWNKVMGGTDAQASLAQHPATNITWQDAQNFIAKLNTHHQQQPTGYRFRLPTEAEWEFACWAGAPQQIISEHTEAQLATLKTQAWFKEPRRNNATSRNVGELAPNTWGLYDMRGNVWEWTADTYLADGYTQHTHNNPQITQPQDRIVIRGGGYNSERFLARCGARNYGLPSDPLETVGFRIVRE